MFQRFKVESKQHAMCIKTFLYVSINFDLSNYGNKYKSRGQIVTTNDTWFCVPLHDMRGAHQDGLSVWSHALSCTLMKHALKYVLCLGKVCDSFCTLMQQSPRNQFFGWKKSPFILWERPWQGHMPLFKGPQPILPPRYILQTLKRSLGIVDPPYQSAECRVLTIIPVMVSMARPVVGGIEFPPKLL